MFDWKRSSFLQRKLGACAIDHFDGRLQEALKDRRWSRQGGELGDRFDKVHSLVAKVQDSKAGSHCMTEIMESRWRETIEQPSPDRAHLPVISCTGHQGEPRRK